MVSLMVSWYVAHFGCTEMFPVSSCFYDRVKLLDGIDVHFSVHTFVRARILETPRVDCQPNYWSLQKLLKGF